MVELILLIIIVLLQAVNLYLYIFLKNIILSINQVSTAVPVAEAVVAASDAEVSPEKEYTILCKHSEDEPWRVHSFRPSGHSDIAIYAKHKRFNVQRPDGSLMREE